jgi:hypothetical protein
MSCETRERLGSRNARKDTFMKSILVASALCAVSSLFVFGCGSGETPSPTGETSQDISASNGSTSASAAPKPVCPPHEQTCEFANDKNICVSRCVPDGVMCAKPNCVVCDPNGPQPHAGCTWSTEACQWDCPVCDPVGTAPHAGCTWSTTECQWDCPVCDPPPPPEKTGCSWDPKACVWLCL